MTSQKQNQRKALLILNPVSGIGNPDQLQAFCCRELEKAGWEVEVYLTRTDDDLGAVVKTALEDSCGLVVASGGDGTVAAVAAAMKNSPVPLGIIPSGTWNAIARHFAIPLNPQRAIGLILGEHNIASLDLMDIGDTVHAMNLTIGFSAAMIQSTGREEKRKFGIFAYFSNVFTQILGLKLKRYRLVIDGQRFKTRASEILVANYGIIGLRALEEILNIRPDDGKMDLIILRARTILDAPALFWRVVIKREKITPIYRIFKGCENISITSSKPVIVQADGEIIGTTPVQIQVVANAVQLIIPPPHKSLLPEIEFFNPLIHPPER